jgi:hypothetical protein
VPDLSTAGPAYLGTAVPAHLGTAVPAHLGTAVPAYFHPAVAPADWTTLATPGLPVRAVVLNIADGPGAGPDSQFVAVAAGVAAAGVPVIGYVDTAYGNRPLAAIEAELERYRCWYATSGFFLDQVATSPALLPWYEQVTAAARRPGELVVLNHGTYPDPAYAQLADALVTFEGPWAAFAGLEPPAWARELPPSTFWHLVYDTPSALLDAALVRAAQYNVGTVYITDGRGPNPWEGLPSYFGHHLTALGFAPLG